MALKWEFNRALRACKDLNTSEYAVLLTLSDIANLDGVVPPEHTPSNTELAAQAKVSERTLHAVIKNTEAKGWLKVVRPTLVERARHKKNQYRLCIPLGAPATVAPQPAPTTRNEPQPPPATVAPLKETTKNNTQPPYPPTGAPAAAPAARLRRGEGAKQPEPEPEATPADAVLAKLHPQLEHEHVGRWVRARWRTRVAQALADGWQETDLIRELSKDIGTARSVAGVIDFRLKNLAAPPKPTWTPPPYAPEPVPMVHEKAKRAVIAEARAAMARARERRVAALC